MELTNPAESCFVYHSVGGMLLGHCFIGQRLKWGSGFGAERPDWPFGDFGQVWRNHLNLSLVSQLLRAYGTLPKLATTYFPGSPVFIHPLPHPQHIHHCSNHTKFSFFPRHACSFTPQCLILRFSLWKISLWL